MIIPLGTNRTPRNRPVVTAAIVVAQVFVYVLLSARGGEDPERFGALIEQWGFTGFDKPLGLLTYHWIHVGVFSLALDAMFIIIMGIVVEDRLGHLPTLGLYLAAGAASASVQRLVGGPGMPPIIGAGGAGAAFIGAFLVFAPGALVRLLLLFPVLNVVEVPAGWFIAAAILKDVWWNMGGAGSAMLGTLTGYSLGFVLALGLIWSGLLTRENFDLLYLFRQKQRLREIREAARSVQARQTHLARAASGTPAPDQDAACVEARARISEGLAARDWAGLMAGFEAFTAAAGTGPAMRPGRPVLNRRSHLDAAGALLEAGRRAEASAVFARFLEDHPRDAEAPHVRLLLVVLRSRHLGDPEGAREVLAGLESASLGADDQAILEDLRRELGGAPARKAGDDGTDENQDLRGQGP